MIKTKEEILEILKYLPRPLVGGVCYDKNETPNLRDSCYDMFKEVLEISNPTDILEIGTHSGSGSLMLLSLSNANLSSIDIGHTWIGIDHGYLDWGLASMGEGLVKVFKTLHHFFPDRFRIFIGDSSKEHTIDLVKEKKFQLIFIDGDHSYEGCKKDIETAIRLNIPYILLDDYNLRDGDNDARIVLAKEFNLTPIKIYNDIHNVANIGVGFFKNPNYKE